MIEAVALNADTDAAGAGLPIDAQTLPEAFQRAVVAYSDKVGIRTIGGDQELTWQQLGDRVRAVAGGLAALDVKRGDHVAILMRNLIENHLLDYALAHLGAVPFGIFNSSSVEQVVYQVTHAKAEIVVTEARYLAKVQEAVTQIGSQVRYIIVIDPDGAAPELSANQLDLAYVEALDPGPAFDFEAVWTSIKPEDIACIIYTSGTTGPPKAVQWSHRMITAGMRAIDAAIPLPRLGLISFLPMAHAGGRNNSHHYALVYGAPITVCPDMNDVPKALVDVHPDLFSSSPRVYEKLQVAIEALIAAEPADERAQLNRALELGLRFSRAEESGSTEVLEDLAHLEAERRQGVELFKPILAKVGLDRLEVVIIGGATVAPELVHFFRAIGTPMLEAYGATEVMLNVFNRVDDFKTGTAGKALPTVELKTGDDGEVFCRGPLNMSGYFNDPEKNAEVMLADGWIATGDIGEIDKDGFLKIVDRKKEIIINSHGKNMSPAVIETAVLQESSVIAQCVAIGEGRNYVTGIVTLDPQAVDTFVNDHPELAKLSVDELLESEMIRQEVGEAIERGNSHLNSNEQIKKFAIVGMAWEAGSDILTPTAKVKRRVISDQYSSIIESLYRP